MDPVSSEIGDLLHFMNPAKWLPSFQSVIILNDSSDTSTLVDLFNFAFEHVVPNTRLVGKNVITNLPTTDTSVGAVSTTSDIVDVQFYVFEGNNITSNFCHWTLVPAAFTINIDKVFPFMSSNSFRHV